MTIDQRIAALKPGQTIRLGERTFAERSGDGKTLRFVRETGSGFVVFKSGKF